MKTNRYLSLLMLSACFFTLTSCNKEMPEPVAVTTTGEFVENQNIAQSRSNDSMHHIFSRRIGRELENYLVNLDYPSMNLLSDSLSSEVLDYMNITYNVDAYMIFEQSNPDPIVIRDNMVILGLVYSFFENVDLSEIDVSNPNWPDYIHPDQSCYYHALAPIMDRALLEHLIQLFSSGHEHGVIVSGYAKYMQSVNDILPTIDSIYKLGICRSWWAQ